MKNYVFLDFDGVVNTVYWRKDYKNHEGELYATFAFPSDGFVNNFQAICWLNELYKRVPYEIIITSSWARGNTLKTLTDILLKSGLNPDIVIRGKVRIDEDRTDEILEYIRATKIRGHYVILDDENFVKSGKASKNIKSILKKHLVLINPYSGITHMDMCKAEDVLKETEEIEEDLL